MNNENRVLLATILSLGLLSMYSGLLSHQPETQKPTQQQPIEVKSVISERSQATRRDLPKEEEITLESSDLIVRVGTTSAAVRSISLKKFKKIGREELISFGAKSPVSRLEIEDDASKFHFKEQSSSAISWSSEQGGISSGISLGLDGSGRELGYRIVLTNNGSERRRTPVRMILSWERADEASGAYNQLEAVFRTQKQHGWQREYLQYREGMKRELIVPRGTLSVAVSERYFASVAKTESEPWIATILPAQLGVISVLLEQSVELDAGQTAQITLPLYIGQRDFFALRDSGFENGFPVGLLSKIGLAIMLFLKWIAGIVRNYGVAVILMSVAVSVCLAPFTIASLKSMKKLQRVQPHMEAIKKKHANDAQKANLEMMKLFKEHKVNPAGGCLPMLFQMPIFFALWSAIPHVVEFRGEPFLWVNDLSLPDRLIRLGGGVDINLLPIIMGAVMYLQSRAYKSANASREAAILSGPLMAVMFTVMMYNAPSSIVLYLLTNTAASVITQRIIKA